VEKPLENLIEQASRARRLAFVLNGEPTGSDLEQSPARVGPGNGAWLSRSATTAAADRLAVQPLISWRPTEFVGATY
jgi:hypothetical protein